jgi:hypothetical protein
LLKTLAKYVLHHTHIGIHLALFFKELRVHGLSSFIQWQKILSEAYVRTRWNLHKFEVLNAQNLPPTQKSDTVFIFGSGYSLNDLSPEDWKYFEQHDTLGFSGFIYQKWIRVDYHLIRGWVEYRVGSLKWQEHTQDFAKTLNANPYFDNTIFLLQGDYLGQFCNSLIGYRLLREGSRIFRYRTDRIQGPPHRDVNKGIRHFHGTLSDTVSLAYALGWKKIVLVGVDLYDSRYFWLKPDETLGVEEDTGKLIPSKTNGRGHRYDETHSTVHNGIITLMASWHHIFAQDDVQLSVYNPRSLLTQALPIHTRPT